MDYLGEVISFVLGALGGSLITWQVMKKSMKASQGSSVVDQSGAKAGRDIIGGNRNKSS